MTRRELATQRPQSVWDFMSEVEKAFEDFWSVPERMRTDRNQGFFTPAVDLHEKPDFYLISLDVPGVPQKEIKIDVHDGRLTVSGERHHEEQKDEGLFRRFERSYGRFERSFQLPQNTDESNIKARCENGVLEILVPKAAAAKPKTISIEEKGGLFSKSGIASEPSTAILPEKH